MIDSELDSFKRMNFVEFVLTMGYKLDERESSVRSFVLRDGGGDKVIAKTNEGGHWVYFSVRDPADHGTLVDFVQRRTGEGLGHVKKRLRGHARQNPSLSYRPACKPSLTASVQGDEGYRKKVAAVWKAARWEPEPAYLLGRGLTKETIAAVLFVDTFRQDKKGNILFPHHDRQGLCGYELRNTSLKTFGADTKKGLWYSKNCVSALSIVICESSIDCLSYHQLHGGDAGYVSLGGAIGTRQRDLLTGLFIKAQRRSARVIVATDNDAAGEVYFEQLQLLSPFALGRQTPSGKDWNDDLNRA